MVQTLRSAGSTIPIVLITGTDEEVGGSDSTSHENHVAVNEESCQRYVWTILKRPFPPSDLLQVIVSIKREADLLHTAVKVNDDDSKSLLIDLPRRDGAASQDIAAQYLVPSLSFIASAFALCPLVLLIEIKVVESKEKFAMTR
eukprot:scaffold17_cov187-Ochromonas_danica.AAC.1